MSPRVRDGVLLRVVARAPLPTFHRGVFDPYFPIGTRRPDARVRVYCFPFAGGSAASYRTWQSVAPAWIDVVPVELPGHGTRIGEPLIAEWRTLLAALDEVLAPHLGAPFAFFGHSMGGKIAFELARWLRARGGPSPAHLFISASAGPERPPHSPARCTLSRDDLVAELRRLGGVPPIVFEAEGMLDLFLPILRADFALVDLYEYRPAPPLEVPITAFAGGHDIAITPASMEGWRAQTSRAFTLNVLEDGHFYLESSRDLLVGALTRTLSEFGP